MKLSNHINLTKLLLKLAYLRALVLILSLLFLSTFSFAQAPVWDTGGDNVNSGSFTSTSGAATVNVPASIASGDLIVMICVAQISSATTTASIFSTPTGFTRLLTEHGNTTDDPEVVIFYKVAVGAETGSYSTTITPSSSSFVSWQIIAGRITGADASTPFDVSGGNNSGATGINGGTGFTLNGVTTTLANTLIISTRAVRCKSQDTPTVTGTTLIFQADGAGVSDASTNDIDIHVVQKNQATAAATGSQLFAWKSGRVGKTTGAIFAVQPCTEIGAVSFSLGSTSSRCQAAGSVTYTASSSGSTSIAYSLDATSVANGNTINSSTGEVTYISTWSGTSTITATASGCGGPKTADHTVTIDVNLAVPVFNLGATSGRCVESEARTYGAKATGADSVRYTIDATSAAGGITVIPEIGTLTFPESWTSGTTTVTATAYLTNSCSSTQTATHVLTTGTQHAFNDSLQLQKGESATKDVTINDLCEVDSSLVTVTVSPTNGGTVSVSTTGVITYTPVSTFSGSDSLTYQICKTGGSPCTTAKLYFTVVDKLTDTYFNIPRSSCASIPDNTDGFTMKVDYSTSDSVSLYSNAQVADLDNDGTMEIVVLSRTNLDGTFNQRSSKNLKVLDGDNGTTKYNITTPMMSWDGPTPFAMADLDDDGDIEIIVASTKLAANNPTASDQGYLFCYDHTGTLLWTSNVQYGSTAGGNGSASAVGIADFNGDGEPEVYVYNEIFNARTGVLLCKGTSSEGKGIHQTYSSVQQGISVAADFTTDDGLELAAGFTVYEIVLGDTSGAVPASNTMTPINFAGVTGSETTTEKDGFTGSADIDLDGDLDVIVNANNGTIYAWNPRTNAIIASRASGSTGNKGALFIGDVDGDGTANIGYCRPNAVDMLRYDTTSALKLKWTLTTSDGSGRTGLTMFDFDQNGTQEIVYRDEDSIRILDGSGSSVSTLVSLISTSSTGMDGPIVVDVDNDGSAEILVTSSEGLATAYHSRIVTYRSNTFEWAPSRKIWNQYAYYNSHIEDDQGVPDNQSDHGDEFFADGSRCPSSFQRRPLNAFNVQATIYADDGCPVYYLPDAEAIVKALDFNSGTGVATVYYYIYNRSDGKVFPTGQSISFYEGNPLLESSTLLTTITTSVALPTQSESGTYSQALTGRSENDSIYIIINDDGLTASPFTMPTTATVECNYENNPVGIRINAISPLPVELINFIAFREDDVVELEWETSSEINNDYFVVMKSSDGHLFRPIDTIQGAGYSTSYLEYEATDNYPVDGINYYQLKQVDFNGKESFGPVRTVNFSDIQLKIFPNPAKDEVHVISPFDKSTIRILDVSGKLWIRSILRNGHNELQVQNLMPGLYMVYIESEAESKTEVFKLIIE